jgi:hypothetical protein
VTGVEAAAVAKIACRACRACRADGAPARESCAEAFIDSLCHTFPQLDEVFKAVFMAEFEEYPL